MSSDQIVSPPEATAVAYRAFLTEYGLTNTLRIFEEEWHMLLQRAHSSRTAAAAAVSNNNGEASTDVRESVELTSTIHAVQPAATLDEDEAAMATVRSMDTTTNDDSTPKQPCAPPPSLMGSATLSAVSLPDPSPLLAAADAPAIPQEAAAVSPNNEVVVNKYGIISGPGLEEHLWELVEDQPEAPVFPYGAGYQAEVLHKCGIDIDADVPRVATHPYLKEPPPSGLPLESFDLRVIYEAGRTGFEEAKDFPIVPGSVIAGRYQILQYLDSAAFSRAVKCLDLKHQHEVCIKIIRNSKDFFDQSLDEIKLLQYINAAGNADENCVLQLYDFFYFKEHIFIVCELLRDNLYEFSKYNREHESEAYFTLARVQAIARQVLTGLAFIHDMSLMHCDLKPENILVKSYSRCEVRVIDFGSSCFTTDNLSSYIQSRCYRAPEVILGCHYDGRIDVWSVGCILPELMTGNVMFHNKTVAGMLTRIAGVCGPFPQRMLHEGRHTCRFVTKHGLFYESKEATGDIECHFPATTPFDKLDLGTSDAHFRDFIRQALTVDYTLRPTAKQLLRHPFFQQDYGAVFSAPPQKRSLKGGAASPQ